MFLDWRKVARHLELVLPGTQITDLHAKLLEKFAREYRRMPNSRFVSEVIQKIRAHAYELGWTIPHVSTWVDKNYKFFKLAVDGSTKLTSWMMLSIQQGLFCTFKRLHSQAVVDKTTLEITLKYTPYITIMTPEEHDMLLQVQSLNELSVECLQRAVVMFEKYDKAA